MSHFRLSSQSDLHRYSGQLRSAIHAVYPRRVPAPDTLFPHTGLSGLLLRSVAMKVMMFSFTVLILFAVTLSVHLVFLAS